MLLIGVVVFVVSVFLENAVSLQQSNHRPYEVNSIMDPFRKFWVDKAELITELDAVDVTKCTEMDREKRSFPDAKRSPEEQVACLVRAFSDDKTIERLHNVAVAAHKAALMKLALVSFGYSCSAEVSRDKQSTGMICASFAKVVSEMGGNLHAVLTTCIATNVYAYHCFFGMGIDYLRSGDNSLALKAFRTTLLLASGLNASAAEIGKFKFNTGVAYRRLGKAHEGESLAKEAFTLAKDDKTILIDALRSAAHGGRPKDVADFSNKLLKIAPKDGDVYFEIGEAMAAGGIFNASISFFHQSAALLGNHVARPWCRIASVASELCDWVSMENALSRAIPILLEHQNQFPECIQPLQAVMWPISPEISKIAAIAMGNMTIDTAFEDGRIVGPIQEPSSPQPISRLNLGYISSNLQGGAVYYMIQGLWYQHQHRDPRVNPSWVSFDVHLYSTGPLVNTTESEQKSFQQIEQNAVGFLDLSNLTYVQGALNVRKDGLQVMIDINGWTDKPAHRWLALRLAPVQIGFMGYPGTMGASFIDYLVSDRVASPPDYSGFYTEKLILLPTTYYVNAFRWKFGDKHKATATIRELRRKYDVPEAPTVVFVSFNRFVKLDRRTFVCWMQILEKVPNSVLWLLNMRKKTAPIDTLKRHLMMNNISPDRIVLAPFVSWEENIERAYCADVFLDSFGYNGHSSAANALWVGIPMLTRPLEKMASRVGASLMNSVGSPLFIARNDDDYVQLAVRFAEHAGTWRRNRENYVAKVAKSDLFNAEDITGNYERGILMSWDLHQNLGNTRYHIVVNSILQIQ